MDKKRGLLIVNIITFGRVPFVVLFMALAIVHAYCPEMWILAVTGTVSLALASLVEMLRVISVPLSDDTNEKCDLKSGLIF